MRRKRALIVDDSKSARVILSRMLEKYDIEVDMAESAEQAIEYLQHNRPDAIFMDHLMPGMDGLQAVQAIKGNPQTAMIPIMMYTSQEGELYVGQARALGAMGVLPKQVRPVDVSKVLYELHLLPDRRDARSRLLCRWNSSGAGGAKTAGTGALPAAWRAARIRCAARSRDQGAVRRFAPLHRCEPRQLRRARRQRRPRFARPARARAEPAARAGARRRAPNRPGHGLGGSPPACSRRCLRHVGVHAPELAKSRAEARGARGGEYRLGQARADLASAVKDLTRALDSAAAANAAPNPGHRAPVVACRARRRFHTARCRSIEAGSTPCATSCQARRARVSRHRQGGELRRPVLSDRQCDGRLCAGEPRAAGRQMRRDRQPVRGIRCRASSVNRSRSATWSRESASVRSARSPWRSSTVRARASRSRIRRAPRR